MPELVYRCSLCQKVYSHEALALKCERRHEDPSSFCLDEVFWQPTDVEFPEKISVTLEGVAYSKIYQRVSKESS